MNPTRWSSLLLTLLAAWLLAGCQNARSTAAAPGFASEASRDAARAEAVTGSDDFYLGAPAGDPAGPQQRRMLGDDAGLAFAYRRGRAPSDGEGDGGDALNRFVDSDGDGLPDQRVEPARERMLVYRGRVRVEVARAEDASKEFLRRVEQWGGYLQKQEGTALTVRVPAEHFDDAFAAARAAGRVLGETREADDVTEEFVDLGIRVDNARRSRERLLEVLAKADEVEDILKVEKELRRLTEEIERMEGRLKYLRDQVAMSTLRAEFESVAEAPEPVKRRRWSRFDWINRVGPDVVMEAF